MDPRLALLITVAFIAWLFRRDFRQRPNVTNALWLPFIWVFLLGSRSVCQWIAALGLPFTFGSLEEGNPLDAFIFLMLIVAGFRVVLKRQVRLEQVTRNNAWLTVFFLYCFVAVLWSDFPFVAFKRWIKVLGHPIMALIILTEPDPKEAVVRLLKRSAYILLPVSILFIKYFDSLGRGFDEWSGEGYNMGITQDKNQLGYVCMILGIFYFWHLLNVWKTDKSRARRNELYMCAGFLWMVGYLMQKAHSSTSLMCLMIGIGVLLAVGWKAVKLNYLGTYIVVTVSVLLIAEFVFGMSALIIQMLGKDPTLTGRTGLWGELLQVDINPIIGTGFESFWLGKRLDALWAAHWWHPVQAHNGYLETYLNLGLIGLALLLGLFFATYTKIRAQLFRDFEMGRLRLAFLISIIVYNWTEAGLKALHLVCFVFYLIAMDFPKRNKVAPVKTTVEVAEPEEEPQLV